MNNVQNNINEDLTKEESFKWIMIPKSVFKKYDSYCYSELTDDKPKTTSEEIEKTKEIKKLFEIATMLDYKELVEFNNNFREQKEKEKIEKEKQENGEQENREKIE